jgi:hypothetical protein
MQLYHQLEQAALQVALRAGDEEDEDFGRRFLVKVWLSCALHVRDGCRGHFPQRWLRS